MYMLTNVNLIVPVVAAVAVIVIAVVVICVLRGNNRGFPKGDFNAHLLLFAFAGTIAPPFGGKANSDDGNASSRFPGLPDWLDLDVIVPVVATVIVVCVGILVVCVAITRKRQPPLMPPG